MSFLLYGLLFVATFILSALLRPKPEIEDARPSGLDDFGVPTASEGRVVPVIFGLNRIKGPNVVWSGDFVVIPITDKVKTGLFSSERVTTGFRYKIGLQFALCRGPIDNLKTILIDEEEVASPGVASGPYSINAPNLFGGPERGGGVIASGNIFPGDESQLESSYLDTFQSGATPSGAIPAYRGTCYLTFEQGEVGEQASLRPFAFDVERYPNTLGLAGGKERIGDSCNPMAVVHEALTNSEWGLNVGSADINEANLTTIADTLFTEGNGFNFAWVNTMDVGELIREVERQVDGVLFINPVTGQYDFKLIRFDYTPGTLPKLDESNVLQLLKFSRPAWDETTNMISLKFVDIRKNFTESFALAHDMANVEITRAVNHARANFPGVKDQALANDLVWRELRQQSFPLASVTLELDRTQFDITVGDVREWSWDALGISDLILRVTKVDYGRLDQGRVRVEFTEDIFGVQTGAFSEPTDTNWIPPIAAVSPFAAADQRAIEAPFVVNRQDPASPTTFPRIAFFASDQSGGAVTEYEALARETVGSPVSGTYESQGTAEFGLMSVGDLRNAEPGLESTLPVQGVGSIEVDPVTGSLDDLVASFTDDRINQFGEGVAVIDPGGPSEEWLTVSAIVTSGGGVELQNVWRGALDSTIKSHSAGERIWFAWTGGLFISDEQFTEGFFADAKLLPKSVNDEVLEGAATATAEFQFLDEARYLRPLVPDELHLNATRLPGSAVDGDSGITFSYTRRQWRTTGAIAQVRGLDEDLQTPFAPDGSDSLAFNWWLFDLDDFPTPTRPDARLNDTEGPVAPDSFFVSRDGLLIASGGTTGTINARIEIEAEHDPAESDASVVSREALEFDFQYTLTATDYASEVGADSPAGYWRLGEASGPTASDSSGNGRDGTYNGTPGFSTAGLIFNDADDAVTFDGDDHVDVPSTALDVLGGSAQDFALEVWASFTTTANNLAILDKTDVAGNDWILVQIKSNGGINFQLFDGSSNPSVTSGTGFNDGNPHHIVAQRDTTAGEIALWIDGVLIGTASDASVDVSSTTNLGIGARDEGADRFFDGVIDEAAVYFSALSPERIRVHHAVGADL